MSEPVLDLVLRLESLSAKLNGAALDEACRIIEERQEILTLIQSADTRSLEPGVQREFRARIRAVMEQDEAVLDALVQLRTDTTKSLDSLTNARGAVRGYRTPGRRPGRRVDTSA